MFFQVVLVRNDIKTVLSCKYNIHILNFGLVWRPYNDVTQKSLAVKFIHCPLIYYFIKR